MHKTNLAYILLLLVSIQVLAQESLYTSLTIPSKLRENANAVVRYNHVQIALNSSYEMSVLQKRVVTILNKEGDDAINAVVHYDNNVKIKNLEVKVYNNFGTQINKFKKNDFKDVSAVDGGTLYSDSRVKYLEYTAVDYPYSVEFISETVSNNTAFIQPFMPIDDYFLSIERSTYQINYPTEITLRTLERNFDNYELIKEEASGVLKYKVKNINAFKPEKYAPAFFDLAPKVLLASNQFTLEGVQAKVENWNDFGKWMYHDLIKDTHDLPESTIAMIQELVKDEPNDIEKAKKIYKYVQDKTRYISVQVGIGGWKPFNASDVDKLGYGDCKGLTNYTMALLNAVGVKSNYCVVWRYTQGRSIEKDFTSMQGNHVFLNIPTENNEDIWLECTSQKLPFGFIANSTDDRDVLVITTDGGEIKHTKKYNPEESIQTINGKYSISNDGNLQAQVKVGSKGIQYDDKYWLETETERDLDKHYKKRWRYVNSMSIESMDIQNDKQEIQFIEQVSFNATNYSKVIGDRMLLTVNALNRSTHVPDRYRNRNYPLKVSRGFVDIDEVEIELPSDYKVESMPKNIAIENKFGHYKTEIEKIDENKLLYKREFKVNDGEFPKEDYEKFRSFYKTVSRQDNAKIALIKK